MTPIYEIYQDIFKEMQNTEKVVEFIAKKRELFNSLPANYAVSNENQVQMIIATLPQMSEENGTIHLQSHVSEMRDFMAPISPEKCRFCGLRSHEERPVSGPVRLIRQYNQMVWNLCQNPNCIKEPPAH